jgi:hypothetical protein
MPAYSLLLNSSNKINKNTFQYNFINGNLKVPEDSEIALSQVTIPYSFINVSAQLGNNTFTYSLPSSANVQTANTVTLADGFYTIPDINTALHATMKANGHYWYSNIGTYSTQFQFVATVSATNLTVSSTSSPSVQLILGTTISGYGISAGTTVVSQTSEYVYVISNSYTITTPTPMIGSQGSEIEPPIIYPISILLNPTLYTASIYSITIPVATDIQNKLGSGYLRAQGNDSQKNWTNGYTTLGTFCGFITIPTTTSTTTTIGNLLGFTAGNYPSTNTSIAAATIQQTVNGNSLSANPPFPILATQVNGIVVLCNLVDNNISMPSTILDSFPINATYGSNITYLPISDNAMKMRAGSYANMTIQFVDQSFVPLNMIDQNVLISLIIRIPNKK